MSEEGRGHMGRPSGQMNRGSESQVMGVTVGSEQRVRGRDAGDWFQKSGPGDTEVWYPLFFYQRL